MVEHPVEQDPEPPLVSGGDEPVERGISAQPGIDPVVVDRVIAMGGGLEYRAEHDPGGTEIGRIVQPRTYAVKPIAAVAIGASSVGAGETKRVHQPPQHRRDPGWLGARCHGSGAGMGARATAQSTRRSIKLAAMPNISTSARLSVPRASANQASRSAMSLRKARLPAGVRVSTEARRSSSLAGVT